MSVYRYSLTTSLGRNLTKSSNTKLTKYNSFVENRDGYFGIGRAMNLSQHFCISHAMSLPFHFSIGPAKSILVLAIPRVSLCTFIAAIPEVCLSI